MDFGIVGSLRRKAAVGSRNHVLSADQPGKAQDALRDEFWMLDDIARVGDHSRDESFAVWQPDAAAFPPLEPD